MKLTNTPTRRCPHRYCRLLHAYMGAIGTPALLILLVHSIANVIWFIGLGALSAAVLYYANGRKSEVTLQMEDIADQHARAAFNLPLNIRPGWARTAVTCDAVFALGITSLIVSLGHMLTAGDHTGMDWNRNLNGEPTTTSSMAIATITSLGIVLFREIAHRMASRPRKPKRATAWADNTATGATP